MDRVIKQKRWTLRRILWVAGGLAALILVVYGLLTASDGSTLRVEADKLTLSQVIDGEFQEYIPVNGEVIPQKTVYLDAMQGGRVVQVFLEEGSFVKAGDKILQLDNTDLHLDIMYREAQLFEQINNLRNTRLAMEQNSLALRGDMLEIDRQLANAKRLYTQSQQLFEKQLNSAYEFQQVKDDFDYWVERRALTLETQRQDSVLRISQISQLEESVERMQANLEIVKSKLEDLILRAPIAGQLTALDAEIGVSKSVGSRLGKIDVLEGFKLRAYVDEYYIARIGTRQSGTVTIAGTVYNLVIEKVYPEVRDGRFQIDLKFAGGEPDGIRQGQSVQARIALGNPARAIMIPSGGFYHKTGGNWVFVVDESGEFAVKRDISIGMRNPQMYEVLDGLEPGETVITSSYDTFEDFDRLVFTDR